MKKIFFYYVLTTTFIYLNISASVVQAVDYGGNGSVGVNTSIEGKGTAHIFGYTAPSSIVRLIGTRMSGETQSNPTGYFTFTNLPVSWEAKEICLMSIDSERRSSYPLCIPVPDSILNKEIGPILLSPTLSIPTSTVWQNTTLLVTGRTIPNSTVDLVIFNDDGTSPSKPSIQTLKVIRYVLADSNPTIRTTSDSSGEFRATIPSNESGTVRVFSKGYYQDQPTPKSVTLTIPISPTFWYLIRFIIPNILLIIIGFLVIAGIVGFLKTYRGKYKKTIKAFIETELKPFGVRFSLSLKRLEYKLRNSVTSLQ